MPLSNQMRAQLGKMSFLQSRKAMEQRLRRNQPQDGVSQELKHFVIAAPHRRIASGQRFYLAGLRTVSEGLLNEFLTLEVVPQAFFQRHDVGGLHDSTMARRSERRSVLRGLSLRLCGS